MIAIGPLGAWVGWILVAWAAAWTVRRVGVAQRGDARVWLVLFAGAVALRLPRLLAPNEFSPDESQSLAGALTLLHDPRFWVSVDGATAGPLHFFAQLPAGLFPGPAPYFMARLLALLLVFACLYVTSRVAARFAGEAAAMAAAFTAAVAYSASPMPDFQHLSTELVALLLVTLAIANVVLTEGPLTRRRAVVVGLLAGAAPFAKLQALPLSAFVIGFALVRAPAGRRAETLVRLVAAALAPLFVAAAYLTLVDGWNGALIGYGFNNASYVESGAFPHQVVFVELARTLWSDGYSAAWILTAVVLSTAALVTSRQRPKRLDVLLAVVWFAVAAFCLIVPRRPYPHYLYWLLPPAVVLFALALGRWCRSATDIMRSRRAMALALALGVAPVAVLQASGSDNLSWLTRLFARYHRENVAIAAILAPYQHRDDSLAIWGSRSDLYVTTGLPQAIPQAHTQTQLTPGPWQRYFIKAYVERLMASPPFAFVDAVGPGNFLFEDRALAHEAVPALRAYIASKYRQVGTVEGTRIYLRNDRLAVPSGSDDRSDFVAARLIVAAILFGVFIFGAGAALAPRDIADTSLSLCLGGAMALGGAFLIAFGAFAAGLPTGTSVSCIGIAALVVGAARWERLRGLWSDGSVREVLAAWLLFAGWCLGLLALVRTYSGGGWAADWVEHWQRAIFFRDHQPLTTLFAAVYPLTARPPLANVLTATWLELTGVHFSAYQVFLTLFASLALLPAMTLARLFGQTPAAGRWTLLALMLSPVVAQNATFAWTKLPTAFFVLTSVAVLVVAARERSARLLPYAALSLGLGLLTHYSAAPWILALAAAGAWVGRRHWRERSVWTRGALSAAVFGVVVAPWFAWAAVQFGVHGTAVANSTTAAWAEETPVQRIAVALANLADTIVPFPLRRDVSLAFIDQPSPLGRLRDVAFNGYQLNLLLACGLAGLFVLTGSAVGARGRIPRTTAARFLGIAMPLAIVLGIWVHTPRDTWGLMHICLQPAAVLGLAAVAAQLADHRRLRLGWALFAFVDLTLGIGLHFALEHWPVPTGSTPAAVAANEVLNRAAAANACDKLAFHFRFLADVLSVPSTLIWTWLVVLLFTAVAWLRVGSFGFFSRGHRR